jgi:hypothetical protein
MWTATQPDHDVEQAFVAATNTVAVKTKLPIMFDIRTF